MHFALLFPTTGAGLSSLDYNNDTNVIILTIPHYISSSIPHSRQDSLICIQHDKLEFIDGTFKTDNLDIFMCHIWDRWNAIVFARIINGVSKDRHTNYIYSIAAYLVCTELKERFDKVNKIILNLPTLSWNFSVLIMCIWAI